jgi:CTP synthase (UTP-ammonia lyase)
MNIGLIGDFNPLITAHTAIPRALMLASEQLDTEIKFDWLHTTQLCDGYEERLKEHSGLWCVPASPYESMDGALNAIRFARENNIPFLGTCGGFQHAIIEFARNVLGLNKADHAESNPQSEMPVISEMACELREVPGSITLLPGTKIHEIYGTGEIEEEYNCGFHFNSEYKHLFENSGLIFSAFDDEGEVRAAEIPGNSFFIITQYQPERSALKDNRHPLITAFLKASM